MFRIISVVLIVSLSGVFYACGSGEENPEKTGKQSEEVTRDVEKKRVPVEVGIVKKEITRQNVPLTGIIQPIYEVDLVAEASGRVKQINKNLGAYVTPKDVLALIDDRVPLSKYKQAQAQVLSAQNNLSIAKLNLESDSELFKSGDISKLEYENSELAVKTAEANHLTAQATLSLTEKAYQDTRITSPINGLVSRKNIENGTMVNNGMVLFRIVDLSTLKIEVGIPQNFINLVSVGGDAQITISALSGETVPGKIKYISPQADEQSGTFLAEIHFKNSKSNLIRAGMTAKVNLSIVNTNKQLVIPDYALITKNGEDAIYKISKNQANLTPVTVLQTFGSQVTISSGIEEGDTIVVVGMKNLGLNTPIWIETVHK